MKEKNQHDRTRFVEHCYCPGFERRALGHSCTGRITKAHPALKLDLVKQGTCRCTANHVRT